MWEIGTQSQAVRMKLSILSSNHEPGMHTQRFLANSHELQKSWLSRSQESSTYPKQAAVYLQKNNRIMSNETLQHFDPFSKVKFSKFPYHHMLYFGSIRIRGIEFPSVASCGKQCKEAGEKEGDAETLGREGM